MKQRLLTSAVGLVLLFVVLFCFHTWIFHIAISLVAGLAVLEVLQTIGYTKHKMLVTISLVFTFAVSFFRVPSFYVVSRLVILGYLIALFGLLLRRHETIRFEEIGVTFAVSLLIPFALSSLIYIRDEFPQDGLFFVMLVFAGAWFADAGGYFIGRFFGKHKLSPTISPKKTVEGAIGGIAFNLVFFLLMGICYYFYQKAMGVTVVVYYWQLALLGVILAVVGMLGDLSASLIKRQCGVKDFGTIFPGHGGVMDRFDSVLFVAPCLYVLLQIMPLVG